MWLSQVQLQQTAGLIIDNARCCYAAMMLVVICYAWMNLYTKKCRRSLLACLLLLPPPLLANFLLTSCRWLIRATVSHVCHGLFFFTHLTFITSSSPAVLVLNGPYDTVYLITYSTIQYPPYVTNNTVVLNSTAGTKYEFRCWNFKHTRVFSFQHEW